MKARLIFLTIALLLLSAATAYAQTGFDLSWWTVDTGGTVAFSAGGYSLSGTIGQPEVGQLVSGEYTLSGGFWQGIQPSTPIDRRVFLPLVTK